MYNISRLNVYFSLNFMAYPTDAQCLLLIVVVITIIYLKSTNIKEHYQGIL